MNLKNVIYRIMILYIAFCKFCKQPYTSKRIHSKHCRVKCRVAASRLLAHFDLVDERLPYKTAVTKYQNLCLPNIVYIKDYSIYDSLAGIEKHFADVYVSKTNSKELVDRMENKMVKIKNLKHHINSNIITPTAYTSPQFLNKSNSDDGLISSPKKEKENLKSIQSSQREKEEKSEDFSKKLREIKRRLKL